MKMTPEDLARFFHTEYEKLAPAFGYETRNESAVPFDEVPENNRRLMIAVATLAFEKMEKYFKKRAAMRSRITGYLSRTITLDLGQIGPSQLTVDFIEGDKVHLTYNYSGKQIMLDIETVYEQIR